MFDYRAAPVCTATLAAPLSAGKYTVEAGVPTDGQISCEDAELDPLTFSIVQSPSRGTLGPLAGTGDARSFTYTAAAGESGADRFILKANDGRSDSGSVAIALVVEGSDTAPPGDGGPAGPGTSASPATSTGPATPSPSSPAATAPPSHHPASPKPKKCKKDFKKKNVHGKAKCVKKHKKHGAKRHGRS